jgi:prevent-host-death family protein
MFGFVPHLQRFPRARLFRGKMAPAAIRDRFYKPVTPSGFRSKMSDLLAQVRYGEQRLLVTNRRKIVAVVIPVE